MDVRVNVLDRLNDIGPLRIPDDGGELTEIAHVRDGEVVFSVPEDWGLDTACCLRTAAWLLSVTGDDTTAAQLRTRARSLTPKRTKKRRAKR